MSRGQVCDNCETVLIVNDRGDDVNGESAAWLRIVTSAESWDACTRSCAHELLDGPVAKSLDEWTEVVTQIAHTIRDERESEAGETK